MYVGNLSYNTNESQLRELFGQFGTVADAKVVMDRDTGRPRGFAFVEMSSDAEMAKAIEGLNGRELDGRALNVSEARERTATTAAASTTSASATPVQAALHGPKRGRQDAGQREGQDPGPPLPRGQRHAQDLEREAQEPRAQAEPARRPQVRQRPQGQPDGRQGAEALGNNRTSRREDRRGPAGPRRLSLFPGSY